MSGKERAGRPASPPVAAKEAYLKLFPREIALGLIGPGDFALARDGYAAPLPSIRESRTLVGKSWEGSAPTYQNSAIRLGSSAHHEQDHNNDQDNPDDPDAALWSPSVVGVVTTPSAEQEQDHDDQQQQAHDLRSFPVRNHFAPTRASLTSRSTQRGAPVSSAAVTRQKSVFDSSHLTPVSHSGDTKTFLPPHHFLVSTTR
jgi:hypothetical protein